MGDLPLISQSSGWPSSQLPWIGDANFSFDIDSIDLRTPSPILAAASPNRPGPACDGTADSHCVGSRYPHFGTPGFYSEDSAPVDSEPGCRILLDIPWLVFRATLSTRLRFDDQPREPPLSGLIRDGLDLERRQGLLSCLLPGLSQCPPGSEQTPVLELNSVLNQAIPGYLPQEGTPALRELLRLPGHAFMSRFAELAFGVISNNLVSEEGMGQFLSFVKQHRVT